MRALSVVVALGVIGLPQSSVSVRDVLRAAGTYADSYHRAFTTVVAEEHYVQTLGDNSATRTLRSDVMLIRGAGRQDAWFFFRDVFEVDGQTVSSDRGRLEAWMRSSRDDFVHRARGLALEQARHNLGNIVRTINVPLIPLEFLLPRNQERFRCRAAGSATIGGVAVSVLTYEERDRPTMIRTPDGDDVEARGTFWIDAAGRVLRTELITGERKPRSRAGDRHRVQVRATITVTYEPNERLNMLVPAVMAESYDAGVEAVTGVARYSNFRRFETDARLIR